jgi:hypothetical protein
MKKHVMLGIIVGDDKTGSIWKKKEARRHRKGAPPHVLLGWA